MITANFAIASDVRLLDCIDQCFVLSELPWALPSPYKHVQWLEILEGFLETRTRNIPIPGKVGQQER